MFSYQQTRVCRMRTRRKAGRELSEFTDFDSLASAVSELRERVTTLEESSAAENCDTFTVQEVAKRLKVSIDTVRRMLSDPDCELVGIKISPGRVVIRRSVLRTFLLHREQDSFTNKRSI